MVRALFMRCDLSNANLARTDLSGADLSGADLTNCDLTQAKLTDAIISNEQLGTVASLEHAIMPDGERFQPRKHKFS